MTAPDCNILGILDDGLAGLGDDARQCLHEADLVIGAARTLALLRELPGEREWRTLDGALGDVPGWIRDARAAGRRCVVLATGDPLCHGIGRFLVAKLGTDGLRIVPAPSTLQLACARLHRPWQDYRIASCHSGNSGEWNGWDDSARPEHALYPLLRAIAESPRVAAFTGPENTPTRLARALLAAGYGDEIRLSVAARLALADEALFADLRLTEAATREFPQPNVVLIERDTRRATTTGRHGAKETDATECAPRHAGEPPLFGIPDADFVQRQPEKGLITKLEARAVSLAKLALRADSIVWDIGAGSGAVGLEASRLCPRGHVFAIEKNAADAANARANAYRLRATNYTLQEGKAPAGLDSWPAPDAVFIGGSGGELTTLIDAVLRRLRPGGRLVMNFVTLENLATATATLARLGAAWDVVMLQAARSQPILDMHRLAAQNPVWIVGAQAGSSPESSHD
ncbi:precorrin-6y C5,15-methyltransferase (decarboxylating) subunit CbiE [Rhodocyclus gracilis]|uniref:Precorrin-6y C5,15-methyltransferase (Decarboxylating) subunit CbiE n=1 Tax=Rhodocyclus tenuis TaxID=1066 RepID=A0A6L5JZS4_RHOTE|nr:precorrin-6y C5,15-methyltransferase (decarboxylating) subunit CbiE [Rhodocyclus gracilis]